MRPIEGLVCELAAWASRALQQAVCGGAGAGQGHRHKQGNTRRGAAPAQLQTVVSHLGLAPKLLQLLLPLPPFLRRALHPWEVVRPRALGARAFYRQAPTSARRLTN